MTSINSLDELLKKMSENKIKNILIGNGFCLSHPVLKDYFQWDMHQVLCKSWEEILPNKSKGCPEKDLNTIRINITKKILQYYIDGIKSKISSESENLSQLFTNYKSKMKYDCSKFLSAPSLKGGCIFTLNYDPLLYFEVLNLINEKIHSDGFIMKNDLKKDDCLKNYYDNDDTEKEFLNQDYVACKLEKDKRSIIKILYLHGSWFILTNKEDELKKISFSDKNEEDITVGLLFANEEEIPYLIFEDRWETKKALIYSAANKYLRYCYRQLKKIEGNLLIFGCSFNNDEHILQALSKNKNLKQIFVTYLTDEDGENLKRKLSSYPALARKTEYLKVSDHVIWEENKIG